MSIHDTIRSVHLPKPRSAVMKEIASRWSPKLFNDSPILEQDLACMFEAARWTPSGHNQQPWYFYYTKKNSAAYKKLFPTLNEYNQSWAVSAPMLILACAVTTNPDGDNPFAYYDLGAAVISFVLQAEHLGYHARQMGLFDKNKVKTLLHLKKELDPYIIIALGKESDYKTASKSIISMELDPRPRRQTIAEELQ